MVICSCPDVNTREVLKLVCDLYALERIWKDIGTYRNVDYVAPNKAKASLVDSFNYFSVIHTVNFAAIFDPLVDPKCHPCRDSF
jgi:hypothetical protein